MIILKNTFYYNWFFKLTPQEDVALHGFVIYVTGIKEYGPTELFRAAASRMKEDFHVHSQTPTEEEYITTVINSLY